MIALPGYGKLPAAEPIAAVLKELAAYLTPSTIIVGWSLGGLLAVDLARQYPDRVRALVLIAALPCFSRQHGWAAGWDPSAAAVVRDRLQQDPAAASRYVAALAVRGEADAQQYKRVLDSSAVTGKPVLQRDLDYMMTADRRHAFAALEQPIHVWLGMRDALIGGDCAAALRALRPDTSIHELPRTGHAPLLSRAGPIAAGLESLCER